MAREIIVKGGKKVEEKVDTKAKSRMNSKADSQQILQRSPPLSSPSNDPQILISQLKPKQENKKPQTHKAGIEALSGRDCKECVRPGSIRQAHHPIGTKSL